MNQWMARLIFATRNARPIMDKAALEIESLDDEVTVRPARGSGQLAEERSVWVFQSGVPLSAADTDNILECIREERDSANAGELE